MFLRVSNLNPSSGTVKTWMECLPLEGSLLKRLFCHWENTIGINADNLSEVTTCLGKTIISGDQGRSFHTGSTFPLNATYKSVTSESDFALCVSPRVRKYLFIDFMSNPWWVACAVSGWNFVSDDDLFCYCLLGPALPLYWKAEVPETHCHSGESGWEGVMMELQFPMFIPDFTILA